MNWNSLGAHSSKPACPDIPAAATQYAAVSFYTDAIQFPLAHIDLDVTIWKLHVLQMLSLLSATWQSFKSFRRAINLHTKSVST